MPLATSVRQSAELFVLACLACGTPLDRARPEWQAQAPERAAHHRYSYRVSQLLIGDIDLAQIVAAWRLAIRDPEQMIVFCTDRLALPKSSAQTLTPHDLQTAQAQVHPPYRLQTPASAPGRHSTETTAAVPPGPSVGGLDLGDQCWFVARQLSPDRQTVRLLWIEPIAAERVRTRVPELFRLLNLQLLCVDAGPLRDLARDLTFTLNGLHEDALPSSRDPARNLTFTRGGETLPLRWHAETEKWSGLRAVPVEFTQRSGQGIRHKIGRTQDDRLYPLLAAHREESIARVIRELTAHRPAAAPIAPCRFLLPQPEDATREALTLYHRHLLTGSRQERSADGRTLRYLDHCENHYLLATAYAALAELLLPGRATGAGAPSLGTIHPLPHRPNRRLEG